MSLKLADAIRLGAMNKPQGRGNRGAQLGTTATCALGAAADALGVLDECESTTYFAIRRRYPWAEAEVPCPCGCGSQQSALTVIWHLNDSAVPWNRDQIADWVATVEPSQEPQPEAKLIETPVEV